MPNLSDISGARDNVDVPFTDWRPDVPAFRNPGFPGLLNAYPADNGLYKPFNGVKASGLNGLKDVIPAVTNNVGQLQGFREPGTNDPFYYTAAADAVLDDMYFFQFDENLDTWTDVTPAPIPAHRFNAHAYFSSFGTRVYATAGREISILAKDIGGVDLFTPITDAHRFTDATIVRGFLMGINYVEGVAPNNLVSSGVAWSSFNDPEAWPNVNTDPIGAASTLRGETVLIGGGSLQRIIPGVGGADAIIIGESKIWRVTFVGSLGVWDFSIIAEDAGTNLPSSVISDGDNIIFYGRRGWMRFDGSTVRPIGAGRVDFSFIREDEFQDYTFDGQPLAGFNRGMRAAMFGKPYADSVAALLYRSASEDTLAPLETDALEVLETDQLEPIEARTTSAFADTLLFFNTLTGRWGNAKLDLQVIGRVESDRSKTDTPELAGLNTDLELVRFTGATLNSIFRSAEATGEANNPITLRRCWPYINNDNCTIRTVYRNTLGADQELSDALVLEADGSVPLTESGLYVAVQMELDAGEAWLDGFIGLSVEFADQGLGAVNP